MTSSSVLRALLGGATVGALALTGCSAVETNGPAGVVQPTPLADSVVVSQPYCASDGEPVVTGGPVPGTIAMRTAPPAARTAPVADPGCGAYDGFHADPTGPAVPPKLPYTTSGGHRLLVAVQVGADAPAPELSLRRRSDVAFAEDPDVVENVTPAPDGRRWIGYRSTEVRFAPGEPNAGDVVDARVAIPRGDVRPATQTLRTTIAIGAQVTGDGFGAEYDADRPVDCTEDLAGSNDGPDSTTCPGPPSGPVGGGPGEAEVSIDPTDVALGAPEAEVPVVAGETATVPFTVARSGEVDEPTELPLSATTSVPGTQATPSRDALPWDPAPVDPPTTTDEVPPTTTTVEEPPTTTDEEPPATTTTTDTSTITTLMRGATSAPAAARDAGPGSVAVPVSVAVPAGTSPGVYEVTLRAEDEGGSRTATARLRVAAAPVAATPAAPAPPVTPDAAPAPVTPAQPRKTISATVKLLRSAVVSRRTRRLHLGSVSCVRTAGTCTVRTRVRVGGRTIGSVTRTVRAQRSTRLTLRLTRANLARLSARSATATTTVSAAGSDDVVRRTTVRAKAAPRRRG